MSRSGISSPGELLVYNLYQPFTRLKFRNISKVNIENLLSDRRKFRNEIIRCFPETVIFSGTCSIRTQMSASSPKWPIMCRVGR